MTKEEFYGLQQLAKEHPDSKIKAGLYGEAIIEPGGPMTESDWERMARQIDEERDRAVVIAGVGVTKQLIERA